MAKSIVQIKEICAKKLLAKKDYLKEMPTSCLDYMASKTKTTHCLKQAFPGAKVNKIDNQNDQGADKIYDFVYSNWLFPAKHAEITHFDFVRDRLKCRSPWFFTALGSSTLSEYCQMLLNARNISKALPWLDVGQLGNQLVHAGFTNTVLEAQYIKIEHTSASELLETIKAIHECFDFEYYLELQNLQHEEQLAWVEAFHPKDLTVSIELIIGTTFRVDQKFSTINTEGVIAISPKQISRSSK